MKSRNIFSFLAAILVVTACDSDDQIPDPAQTEISSKINVKAKVGDVLYEDISATVVVKGFSASDELKWSEEFAYEGAESQNILTIPLGYQYYVITAKAWSGEDSQTISGQQLYQERADGPAPTTYVFAPEVEAPKLKSVIRSMETDLDGEMSLLPFSKEEFIWTDDVLSEIRSAEYNNETESFDPSRKYQFTYEDGRVSKISGFHVSNGQLFIETLYEYFPNGNVQRIVETNYGSGLNTEATFIYNYDTQQVNVSYSHSNGQSFVYKIALDWKNITWDQTVKGTTICSEGSYTFDQGINPYRHLGYMDILMGNLSINNKTDEDVDYVACAFPELTVQGYEYTYHENGSPISKTIRYSNGRKGTEVYTY